MTKLFFISLITLVFLSCSDEKRKADTSKIDLDIKIGRFDIDFWALDTNNLNSSIEDLKAKYPTLLPIYLEQIVEFGNINEEEAIETYRIFKRDTNVIKLYSDALNSYSDIEDINKELTTAFKRAKYFFPNIMIPRCCFHVAGLNPKVAVSDTLISLGIDNYLGEDYPIYEYAIYPYLRQNMRREKVVPDFLNTFLSSNFIMYNESGVFLDEMINRGKIIYITSVLLPTIADKWLIGYTDEQMIWAQTNEKDLWNYFVSSKILFSKSSRHISEYLNDAPYTTGLPAESPGRLGTYIGWQIVEAYMKNNKEITPLELIRNNNGREILEKSDYLVK